MESETVPIHWPDNTPLVSARECILRLLGMAQRPLRWLELTNALGRRATDARMACEWLVDYGYIVPTQVADDAVRSVEAVWTLADKGLAWARENDALWTTRDAGTSYAPA